MANHSTVWLRWGGPEKRTTPTPTPPKVRATPATAPVKKLQLIQTPKPNKLPNRNAISYIGSGYVQISTSATYYIYGF